MSITEVAKRAGVSSSTVSRVMNNHPRVAAGTAEAVRRAMKELNYAPSDRRPGPKPSFRSRLGTANIAFLVVGASSSRATPAFEDLLRGVSQGTAENDLNLIFSHLNDPNQLPALVVDRQIDAVLLHGAAPGADVQRKLRKLPTVWLMGNRRRPEWGDQVMPDSYAIGDLAARYFARRGHRNLAFLNLDAGHWPFRLYHQAFASAAAESGGTVERLEELGAASTDYWHHFNPDAVERLARRLLALSPRPTGIFVADDMQVAMLQPILQNMGLEMGPGKAELISCNNERPYLVGLTPRPAAIDIRVESIGRRGVEQLIWRLERPDLVERITVTVEPYLLEPDPVSVGADRTLSALL